MSSKELLLTKKGALYSCECAYCGATMFAHEWGDEDFNDRRDAMENGTLRCDGCGYGKADPDTVRYEGRHYAGCYLAPGYLGSTPWEYDRNYRRLRRTLREIYGD